MPHHTGYGGRKRGQEGFLKHLSSVPSLMSVLICAVSNHLIGINRAGRHRVLVRVQVIKILSQCLAAPCQESARNIKQPKHCE